MKKKVEKRREEKRREEKRRGEERREEKKVTICCHHREALRVRFL